MDLKAIEAEANAAALKQVAAMLQRPDQLEKLDLYKKKAVRKKVLFLFYLFIIFIQLSILGRR
jgi:hypothetical protein